MNFKYELVALSTIDYHLLLRLDSPEEIMLAILADLGKGSPKRAIENIVKQVIAKSKGDFAGQRRIQQLRILAQLRNLESETIAIMDSIAKYFSKEKDILYRLGEKEGIEKGIEKSNEAFVRNLLLNTDFSISKVAALVNVTETFVRKIKKALK
jgi:hypothetical protein